MWAVNQFTSTLFVISGSVTPNNQITETPHYASLSGVQTLPASDLPVHKSDFPAASPSPAVPVPFLFDSYTHLSSCLWSSGVKTSVILEGPTYDIHVVVVE